MSWKPEVFVEGKWSRNGLVFETKEEAEASAHSLFLRWTQTDEWRAVEVDEAPNYRLVDGQMLEIPTEAQMKKVLQDLVNWADQLGGWDAPAWNRAKSLLAYEARMDAARQEREVKSTDG